MDNRLASLSYRQLQSIAVQYKVPGNTSKDRLIKFITCVKQGNERELQKLLRQHQLDKKKKRLLKIKNNCSPMRNMVITTPSHSPFYQKYLNDKDNYSPPVQDYDWVMQKKGISTHDDKLQKYMMMNHMLNNQLMKYNNYQKNNKYDNNSDRQSPSIVDLRITNDKKISTTNDMPLELICPQANKLSPKIYPTDLIEVNNLNNEVLDISKRTILLKKILQKSPKDQNINDIKTNNINNIYKLISANKLSTSDSADSDTLTATSENNDWNNEKDDDSLIDVDSGLVENPCYPIDPLDTTNYNYNNNNNNISNNYNYELDNNQDWNNNYLTINSTQKIDNENNNQINFNRNELYNTYSTSQMNNNNVNNNYYQNIIQQDNHIYSQNLTNDKNCDHFIKTQNECFQSCVYQNYTNNLEINGEKIIDTSETSGIIQNDYNLDLNYSEQNNEFNNHKYYHDSLLTNHDIYNERNLNIKDNNNDNYWQQSTNQHYNNYNYHDQIQYDHFNSINQNKQLNVIDTNENTFNSNSNSSINDTLDAFWPRRNSSTFNIQDTTNLTSSKSFYIENILNIRQSNNEYDYTKFKQTSSIYCYAAPIQTTQEISTSICSQKKNLFAEKRMNYLTTNYVLYNDSTTGRNLANIDYLNNSLDQSDYQELLTNQDDIFSKNYWDYVKNISDSDDHRIKKDVWLSDQYDTNPINYHIDTNLI